MTDNDQIEYKFSLPIYLLGLALIVFLTALFALGTYILIIKDFYVLIILFIWLLYGLIFRDAIPKLIRTGINILKKKPALILTNQKLVDNINNQSFNWNEIERIEESVNVRSGSYIAIKVKDPNKFLSQENRFFDRTVMRLNQKYWNGMFAIRPREIRGKRSDILQNLNTYLSSNKNKNWLQQSI